MKQTRSVWTFKPNKGKLIQFSCYSRYGTIRTPPFSGVIRLSKGLNLQHLTSNMSEIWSTRRSKTIKQSNIILSYLYFIMVCPKWCVCVHPLPPPSFFIWCSSVIWNHDLSMYLAMINGYSAIHLHLMFLLITLEFSYCISTKIDPFSKMGMVERQGHVPMRYRFTCSGSCSYTISWTS